MKSSAISAYVVFHEADFERIKNVFLSILKDIKKDMDEKEPTSPPVQMEFLKKLMGAIQELSLPKNPPSPEKAVDWTISQLAKQITISVETRKAYVSKSLAISCRCRH